MGTLVAKKVGDYPTAEKGGEALITEVPESASERIEGATAVVADALSANSLAIAHRSPNAVNVQQLRPLPLSSKRVSAAECRNKLLAMVDVEDTLMGDPSEGQTILQEVTSFDKKKTGANAMGEFTQPSPTKPPHGGYRTWQNRKSRQVVPEEG